MRIESSVNHLFRPVLSEDERQLLDEHLDFIMENNVYANYFLSYLSFRMRCSGSNQMQINYRGFVSLKDKYLKMLSSTLSSPGIDSNDLRISLVGELIFSASQIYYRSADGELVSLIEHLDCPILKEYKIWEVYFLYRVCKSSVTNVLNKQHILCTARLTARRSGLERQDDQAGRPGVQTPGQAGQGRRAPAQRGAERHRVLLDLPARHHAEQHGDPHQALLQVLHRQEAHGVDPRKPQAVLRRKN